jgi:hypothetical protein
MGKDYSLVVKNVEFYVLAFVKLNILATAGVSCSSKSCKKLSQ